MQAWHFIRDHILAAILVIAIVAAVLYRPLSISSPVTQVVRYGGVVAAVLSAGGGRTLQQQPWYSYQIHPNDGGPDAIVGLPSLQRVGDQLTMERVVHANGTVSHRLADPTIH